MKNQLFILLLIISSSFFACKKKKHLLIGSWETVNYEFRVGDDPVWKVLEEACRYDDIEEFDEYGTWTHYDGTNQCVPGLSIYKSQYKISANNKKIIHVYEDAIGEYEYDIELLTEDELVVTWGSGDLANTQYRESYKRLN